MTSARIIGLIWIDVFKLNNWCELKEQLKVQRPRQINLIHAFRLMVVEVQIIGQLLILMQNNLSLIILPLK